jgi:small subunit ribosomal protein S8
MVNDPIGDMLTQIRNAGITGKKTVDLPYSKLKMEVAKLLQSEGYLESISVEGKEPKKHLLISLRYIGKKPVISGIIRKSKPGLRVYVDRTGIPSVVGGMGMCVLSTSKGIMTGKNANKIGIGGELMCLIW